MAMPAAEMVDVVDKADKVIKTVPRTEAEQARLRVRGVQVFLLDRESNMLVQWRKHDRALYPRTFNGSAAGMVLAGETYAQAARRELKEELGVTTPLARVGAYQTHKGLPVNGALFAARWDGEVQGWEDEADALDYWSREEAEFMRARFPYLLAPTFRECLALFLAEGDF